MEGPPAVAISTRDRPDALGRCLDAIAAGELRPKEVVVVDQGEDGRAREVCEARRAAGLPVFWTAQAPRGLAASQNAAIGRAGSPLVAVTDDDCAPDRGWLAAIARTFAAAGAPDVVTGRVLPLPAQPADADRVHPVSSRASTRPADFRGRRAPWPVGSGNNFALRREWFLRVGGCDERLGPGAPGQGGMDMDLFYRLLRAGARARYEPAAVVFHERQTEAERLARRPLYGHGMGAACALWLREGDLWSLPVLGRWLLFRTGRLAGAALRRDRLRMREEALMLGWTARGLAWGLAVREPRRREEMAAGSGGAS